MKLIKSVFTIFFLVTFSSCQNFAEMRGDGILRPDIWKNDWGNCIAVNSNSIYRIYSIKESSIVMREKYYENVGCQDLDLESEDVVYYTYYKYDPNYTLTKISTKRRALTSSIVNEFNNQSECSSDSWVLNTFKDITKITNCDDHEDNPRLKIENRGDGFLYVDDDPYYNIN